MFNPTYWQRICFPICDFFFRFLSKELVEREVQKQKILKNKSNVAKTPPAANIKRKRYFRKKSKVVGPTYFCRVCNKLCKGDNIDPNDQNEFSIQCDLCMLWFHWPCVNIFDRNDPRVCDEFFCLECSENKQG